MADAELQAHREWLGYVQAVGVVVSPPALLAAQAYVNRNVAPLQQLLLDLVEDDPLSGITVTHLAKFLSHVLRWGDSDLLDSPAELERALPEYGEVLRATYAVREVEPDDLANPWLMLVQVLPNGSDYDTQWATDERGWQASPQAKFERLLRETQVPIGLLTNGTHCRLVYAPRGETSGHLTFPVAAMTEVAGRPILAALDMLLGAERLFTLPRQQRLPALLAESRRYQNVVSTRLAGQVLAALYELLRGFQAADDHSGGKLLRGVLREYPDLVYEGLLTVLLRLVFLLYAEDRDLMPAEDVYTLHYSVGGLFDRLRTDAGGNPDTMDLRYGAWVQLLSLFRMLHDGARFGGLHLPPRHGYLFDPDRFPFLEGRPHGLPRVEGDRIDAPLISDGVVWRVLQNLLVLDGERLSYRSLDVEQIGSVYETMMGFRLEIARGHSIAIKPAKPHGPPITIDLDELLATPAAKRAQWVQQQADQKPTDKESAALASATAIAEIETAIERKIERRATPNVVPAGAMILQPNEERRRSGSFYTPRSLTEPIVRTTLRPILERLSDSPTPEALLDLKLCDPAMGSGAFLVEACRQLADKLVDAWHAHDRVPSIPPDSDELLHARRLVAHRCLYGVDRNAIAVDLAKLSLWLATLARDHAFTFLDHALRCGDSLVGLTLDQVVAFHWAPGRDKDYVTRTLLRTKLDEAEQLRARIREAGDDIDVTTLHHLLRQSDHVLDDLRLAGDLVILAFFTGTNTRERQMRRDELAQRVWAWQGGADDTQLRGLVVEMRTERHVIPLHWHIEFPEVFDRDNAGFDAIVGNPPFAGKNTLVASNPHRYPDWLKQVHDDSHGNADLVAHFFRRAFGLLREGGCFGLIATNTIRQGDTRGTGLRWICTHGGTVYAARRRTKWPVPAAAVIVSVVHICRGVIPGPRELDGRSVDRITAYLFHAGGDDDPDRLRANTGKSFQGSIVLGMGFTFDDTDKKGIASSLTEMQRLIEKDRRNAERIFPYIGGEEINTSPTQAHHRYVINFGDMTEADARKWPDLMSIIESRVRPERESDNRETYRRNWWQFAEKRPALRAALTGVERVLACSQISKYLAFAFLPSSIVFTHNVIVLALDDWASFATVQSRPHALWALFFGSSFEDRPIYTAADCFETFPFPAGYASDSKLIAAGSAYYQFRSALMERHNEGLTTTHNRFHDPSERSPDIARLRELHDAMDRAVLDAYGWNDLRPTCQFLLDYAEEDEDTKSERRKPWRYRWPDDVREEVLARLLALNSQRAKTERLQGPAEAGTRARRRKAPAASSTPLFLKGG